MKTKLLHRLGAFVFRHGKDFYNFQGLRQYKSKFHPVWQPKYIACPDGMVLPRILPNLAALISGGIKEIIVNGSDRFNEVLKKFRSAEYRESVALKKGRILV